LLALGCNFESPVFTEENQIIEKNEQEEITIKKKRKRKII
jgi:hypothetical protein